MATFLPQSASTGLQPPPGPRRLRYLIMFGRCPGAKSTSSTLEPHGELLTNSVLLTASLPCMHYSLLSPLPPSPSFQRSTLVHSCVIPSDRPQAFQDEDGRGVHQGPKPSAEGPTSLSQTVPKCLEASTGPDLRKASNNNSRRTTGGRSGPGHPPPSKIAPLPRRNRNDSPSPTRHIFRGRRLPFSFSGTGIRR